MTDSEGIRLNKYLSEAGIASRRSADSLIESGRVTIVRAELSAKDPRPQKASKGMKVMPGDRVFADGVEITGKAEKKVYLCLNKPKGLVCTADPSEKDNVIRYLNYPVRVTYAGRLDKDSRGLLILTNDGDFIDQMMRAANRHEKEYLCVLRDPVTEAFLRDFEKGVVIRVPDKDHVMRRLRTRPCRIRQIDDHTVSVILTQGLNRQIRRMCFALGQQVTDLKRIRIMSLELGDLPEGCSRELTSEEVARLKKGLDTTKRRER